MSILRICCLRNPAAEWRSRIPVPVCDSYPEFIELYWKGKKDLGVNLDKDYEPVYEIPSDKRKVVEELSTLAKKTKTVWLASDEDREGEAIAWHLPSWLA